MKILGISEIENCFDGTFMKEVLFDREVNKEFIFFLGEYGSLNYFPDFPKAFFQLDCPDKFIIKGIEGLNKAKLILYRTDLAGSERYFENLVNKYSKREQEKTPLKN